MAISNIVVLLPALLLVISSVEAVGLKARVDFQDNIGQSGFGGNLQLRQLSDTAQVHIIGQLSGLSPGRHGFHIHQFGNFTNGLCDSAGVHYNPSMVYDTFL